MKYLKIENISTHNLKGLNLKIPLNSLVVITGPSGSGKSSLALNTIAEEGRSRLLQILNYSKEYFITYSYKANFLSSIPPVIALAQGLKDWYPYKNVADFFLIPRFLESLFLEKGEYYCSSCGNLSRITNINEVIKWYQTLKEGTKFYFLLPLPQSSPKALEYLISQGYTKYLIDGEEVDLSEEEFLADFKTIYLILDRMIKEEKGIERFVEDLRMSLFLNNGRVVIKLKSGEEYFFNLRPVCLTCGKPLFINWQKCDVCNGYGYKEKIACKKCKGLKLSPNVLESKVFGKKIGELLQLTLEEFYDFSKKDGFYEDLKLWIDKLLFKIEKALYLELGYLKLCTPVFQLTVGERKILELIQIFSIDLRNCLYILDEPSLGLDLTKKEKLIQILKEIKKRENSIILIEHDPWLIDQADFVIELGPCGGEKGGYLIAACSKEEYLKQNTLTSEYLAGKRKIKSTLKQQKHKDFITLSIDGGEVRLLKGGLNLVYGKVGSGKTRFFEKLFQELKKHDENVVSFEVESFKKRSDWVVSYIGLWDELRKIFVKLPSSRMKGLTNKHFSFVTKEGVCLSCKGKGKKVYESEGVKLEVLCESCMGKRLNPEVLNLEYKGFKIAELLDFTIEELAPIFSNVFKIKEKILQLSNLGLGYLKLSQEVGELSGGEKVRLSLVKKIFSKSAVKYVFLEYPFQGLHLVDIENFIKWIKILLEKDITFIILETNPFAIYLADFIIEIKGKQVFYNGSVAEWLKNLQKRPEYRALKRYENFIEREV